MADRVTGKTSLNGGFGGGHVGLQQQWGSWVLGAEFNYYGGFSLEGTRSCFNPVANCTTELKSWWTVGPRVGYAVNNVLFYGTGGYAQGKIDTHENIAATGVFVNPASATHGGWFAGAGIEWALMPNVILGVEYTHVDLDTKLQLSSPPLNFEHRNIDLTSDSVRARLTFLFGGGKGPVVAKY